MIKRNIKAIAFASLTAAILLTAFSANLAQSGGASLHEWVAFEDVAYVDKQTQSQSSAPT
jgi:ABC-type oligopeptide transport system substrate-binding subunit